MSSQAEILGRGAGAGGAAAAALLHDFGAGMSHGERLAQVRWLAHMLDDNFSIPGTRIRFGWDSVLGFIPGLGDVAGTAPCAPHRASRLADRRIETHAHADARQCGR